MTFSRRTWTGWCGCVGDHNRISRNRLTVVLLQSQYWRCTLQEGATVTDHSIFRKLSAFWEEDFFKDMDTLNVRAST